MAIAVAVGAWLGWFAPVWSQQPPPGSRVADQAVAVGPLTLSASPDCTGRAVQLVVSLHTVTAAVTTLTPQSPRHTFNIAVGVSKAQGEVTSMFMPAGQLSTTVADVVVTTEGQAAQPFKGLIQSWTIASGMPGKPLPQALGANCALLPPGG